jgi:hypothetical protein
VIIAEKSKLYAFAEFHPFLPSNFKEKKRSKRLASAEFHPFVPSNSELKKRKRIKEVAYIYEAK